MRIPPRTPTTLSELRSRTGLVCLLFAAALCTQNESVAAPPVFPPADSATVVRGELVSADFIHRTGEFRTPADELMSFRMPPYAIMTYRGAESDLRDVPLGTGMEFVLIPDESGALTQLIGTRHGTMPDEDGRNRFIRFTRARGLAGWIDATAGRTVTVTFFSGAPHEFAATWGPDFSRGKDVRVCVANDELRTWNPTSTAERGTIIDAQSVPIAGPGCSGWRVVIEVNHMLEGFRQGRVVRVFGPDWKVQNQLFRECLINYGYQAPTNPHQSPDFRECWAKHYPEQFPYRTDHGNSHLPWFRAQAGSTLPSYSEHLVLGELIAVDAATQSGEFRTERTGEVVSFTMFSTGPKTPAIRSRSTNREGGGNARLADLPLGQRYRFHMYQDATGAFTRCSYLSDEYSQLVLNAFNYEIREVDPGKGRIEVTWQGLPVRNYQKETEIPPPFGHSLLRVTPQTRVWNGETAARLTDLKPGDALRINLTSEQPGAPAYCSDVWIIE